MTGNGWSSSPGATPVLDPDAAVLQRIVARDATALAALYDAHGQTVHVVIARVVRDRQIAEDLLQETFLRVWQHAGTFDRQRGRVRAWLLGIAHNLALNELRRRRRHPQDAPPYAPADESGLTAMISPEPDPAEAAVAAHRRRRIAEALTGLPEAQQAVLALYASGHSQSEIAAALDEPLGTVKTRMRRGLVTLRETLGGEGFDRHG